MRRALAREARALARLSDPGIATIHDAGTTEDGRPYIVMQFIEGRSIDRYAVERELPQRERVALLAQVARAVHHAHQRGVLHCDLKPANVLVDDGGAPHVVDFGLARPLAEALGWSHSVSAGDVVGTLPYMSPEQARGAVDEIDVRTDVYGLGAVAYAALVGAPPSPAGTGARFGPGGPAPDAAISLETGAALPRELRAIVAKALRSDPEERYESAAALADDLRSYLEGGVVHAAESRPFYGMQVLVRRNKVAVATLALALATLCAALLSTRAAKHRVERQRDDTMEALSILIDSLDAVEEGAAGDLATASMGNALRAAGQALRAGSALAADSLDAARLHNEIGRTFRKAYWQEGDTQHEQIARHHTRRALDIWLARVGEDHPEAVAALVEHSLLLTGEDGRREARRILGRIARRYEAGTVEPCLGVALALMELSWEQPIDEREALAREAQSVLRSLDVRSGDANAAAMRLAQIAYERGDPEEGARRAAVLAPGRGGARPRARRSGAPGPQAGCSDPRRRGRPDPVRGADARLACGRGGPRMECGVGLPRAHGGRHGALQDNLARQPRLRLGRLHHPRPAAARRRSRSAPRRREPRPGDLPRHALPAAPGSGPFVDNVHASVRLWKVFGPGTNRVGVSLSILSAPRACRWPPTGYELRFVERLYIERTDDPDVCHVTTRHPTDPMLDVDQAQLERNGEVVATYRIPLTWRIERVR